MKKNESGDFFMEINNNVSYPRSVRCADVYTESQTDYVLPDYLGDVRKILYTEAILRPSGRFAGGDEVEFSGVVVYNLIYLDSEGGLSSVEFTSDYDYSVKCSGEGYVDSVANTVVSSYAVRLIGPRKLSAKASLVGSVRLSESCTVSTIGDAFDGELEPEVNMGSVSIRNDKLSTTAEREIAESVARLEGAIADEVRMVHSYAECSVDSVTAEENSACVKGRLRLLAVIKNGDEPAYGVEKTVSLEESVDFEDGLAGLMGLIPHLTVSSLKTNINADDQGCELVMSAIVETYVVGEGNGSVDLMLDGYLKEYPTDNSYDDFEYTCLRSVTDIKDAHTAEIPRSEIESEGLREIVFLSSTPKVEDITCENGAVNIQGEIRYSGIASEMVNEKITYTGIKFTSPFSINVNGSCQNSDNLDFDVEIYTTNTGAMLDAEKLYASCDIVGVLTVSEEGCRRVLNSMARREDEEYKSDEARITVYYPSPADTLFSVAKRYRTSMVKVAQDNDITESLFSSDNPSGNLHGIKKLIIY